MKNFVTLIEVLESTSNSTSKVLAISNYFNEVDDTEKMWALSLLLQKSPKRIISLKKLKPIALAIANIPEWLFEVSYEYVGDLSETISLILPPPKKPEQNKLSFWMETITHFKTASENDLYEFITSSWGKLTTSERLFFNKILTGSYRYKLSQKILAQAIAMHIGKEKTEIAHRLLSKWTAQNDNFHDVFLASSDLDLFSKPYPFQKSFELDKDLEELGPADSWYAEMMWDGIRVQLIKKASHFFLWSYAEGLITHCFPEIFSFSEMIPDGTVIDAILLAFDDKPLNYEVLQKRLNRKKPSPKDIRELPVSLIAIDVLVEENMDLRGFKLSDRRLKLEAFIKKMNHQKILLSDPIAFRDWNDLNEKRIKLRKEKAIGLILKRTSALYHANENPKDWYKWKLEPYTTIAVLLYAQRGTGSRTSLYTEFTFALKDKETLVPIAKASKGLNNEELQEITSFVKNNKIERFGPVTSVAPELVFEIAFDAIESSNRKKSGLNLKNPTIIAWKRDQKLEDIDSLQSLKKHV